MFLAYKAEAVYAQKISCGKVGQGMAQIDCKVESILNVELSLLDTTDLIYSDYSPCQTVSENPTM